MKKTIVTIIAAMLTGLAFAQVAYETPVTKSELITSGSTNTYYIGTAMASPTYTPSTNDTTWQVLKIVTVSNQLVQSSFAYRTSNVTGANLILIKWTDRASTNVTYKAE
jgi:hypothetical protein